MTKKNSKLKGTAGTAVAQTIGIDMGDRNSVHCNLRGICEGSAKVIGRMTTTMPKSRRGMYDWTRRC